MEGTMWFLNLLRKMFGSDDVNAISDDSPHRDPDFVRVFGGKKRRR